MADQRLDIWAEELTSDPLAGNTQRRPIKDEEWLQGWGRNAGLTYQQVNQLFYLLSSYSPPSDISPYLYPDTAPITDNMLEMNGQVITEVDAPYIYAAYGSTLPTMTGAPTGFIYVVRKH